MKLLSGIVAATLTSVVALASANAADMYQPGPAGPGGYKDVPFVGMNWSGLYVGVNGGYGWNADTNGNLVDPSGGFGGGQIGYNWQGFWHPHLVLGVEADFQGADIQDSVTVGGKTASANMDWFGTVRARLGYAFDRALIYATGGFAYGNVTTSGTYFLPGALSVSETQTGWVVGGGVEYKVMPNWSVKGEYQYIDLDASSLSGAGPLAIGNTDRTQVSTVRIGVNYFVGGIYEPLK